MRLGKTFYRDAVLHMGGYDGPLMHADGFEPCKPPSAPSIKKGGGPVVRRLRHYPGSIPASL